MGGKRKPTSEQRGSAPLRGWKHPDLSHPPICRRHNLGAHATRLQQHHLAGEWNPPLDLAHQSTDRRSLVAVVDLDGSAEQICELIHREISRHNPRAVRLFLWLLACFFIFMLIADGAHNLFQQILDGHNARDAAILVNHNAHVLLLTLHLAQQLIATLGLRNERSLMRNTAHGARPRLYIRNLQQIMSKCNAAARCLRIRRTPAHARNCAHAAVPETSPA